MSNKGLNNFYLASLFIGVGILGIPACRREPPEAPRQAIFFLLDAARPDRFSCYGYERTTTPEMDRLARGGALFRRHFAQGTSTRPSMSSMLYSRYYCLPLFPNSPEVPYSNPSNLFRKPDDAQISFVKALRSAGFKTAAVSAHMWTGSDTAFAAEFDEMHDLTTQFKKGDSPYPSAEKVIDYAIEWIRAHRDEDYFLYVHLMDTHYPHKFSADAQRFFGASSYNAKNFRSGGEVNVPDSVLSDDDRRYANALYDGSLRYTDRQIGRLVDFLREEKLIDTTVLAITADHGEHLFDMPNQRTRDGVRVFGHGGPWWDPVARIPLILHYPRSLAPVSFDHLSEGVDLGPTLLALLNVPVPMGKEFDGLDLVQVINGHVQPRNCVLKRRGIRTDKYKCMFSTSDDVLLAEAQPASQKLDGKLYDLVADPAETTDIFRSKPEVVAELLKIYRMRLAAPYARYEAARSSEQPRSAFAISAKHFITDKPLPKATAQDLPDGWSRVKRGGSALVVASKTNDPLAVRFPLPNGSYKSSLRLQGAAVVRIGQRQYESTGGPSVELGEINVTDEVFRAIITPQGDRPVAFSHFGFIPPAAKDQNPDAAREQLERLRALGYVE